MKIKPLITSIIILAFIVPLGAIIYLFVNDDAVSEQAADLPSLKFNIEGAEYNTSDETKGPLYVFGEPVYGDVDHDGDVDAAIMLVYTPGGSGTFYYSAFAISTDKGFKSTNTILLGDRIAPQTVEIHDGVAVYNFAIRKDGEPMTASPSVGKSVWVSFDASSGLITGSDNDGSSI